MAGTSQAVAHVSGAAVIAQQLADNILGRRLTPDEFLSLMQAGGKTIVDGDDEADNVPDVTGTFKRLNLYGLANQILALSGQQVGPSLSSIQPSDGDIFQPNGLNSMHVCAAN